MAGVAITLVGVVFTPGILELMGTPRAVMGQSVTYLRIYFCGSLPVVMYNVGVGILQAVGDSRHPLYYLVLSSVFNLVLDLLFIAGLGGGVAGAALATIISQAISAVLCLWHLMRHNTLYRLQISQLKIDKQALGRIAALGLPGGCKTA